MLRLLAQAHEQLPKTPAGMLIARLRNLHADRFAVVATLVMQLPL